MLGKSVLLTVMASFQLFFLVCVLSLVMCFEEQPTGAQEGMLRYKISNTRMTDIVGLKWEYLFLVLVLEIGLQSSLVKRIYAPLTSFKCN